MGSGFQVKQDPQYIAQYPNTKKQHPDLAVIRWKASPINTRASDFGVFCEGWGVGFASVSIFPRKKRLIYFIVERIDKSASTSQCHLNVELVFNFLVIQ